MRRFDSLWALALMVARQVRRLGLRGTSPAVVLVVLIPAAFVTASFLVTAATTLSPSQQKVMNFGRFDAYAGFGLVQVAPGDDVVARRMAESVGATDVRESMLSLSAVNFYLGGLTEPRARYEEHPWDDTTFPGRYVLRSGRWPSGPGEVAISGDAAAREGQRLAAGDGQLTVTGVVDDLYARKPAILAAPGTWAALDATLATRYETMRAQPFVYWSAGTDTVVLDAIDAAVRNVPDAGARDVLESSYAVAPSGQEARATPWIDKLPIAYLIPATIFPALTVALAFALSGPRAARLTRVSRGLGVPAETLLLAHYIPVVAVLAGGATVGGAIGAVLPHFARGWLEGAAGRPVDLDIGVGWQLTKYVLAVVFSGFALVVVTLALPAWRSRRRHRLTAPAATAAKPTAAGRRGSRWKVTAGEARRLVALGLLCLGAVSTSSVDSPGKATFTATVVMLGVLLLLGDVVRWVLAGLPGKSWTMRLARARLQRRFTSALATTTTIALMIGLTFGYIVLLQTWLTSAQGDRAPQVARGEVLVVNRSSDLFEPPAASVAAVRSALDHGAKHVRLRWTTALDGEGLDTERATVGDSAKPLLVADPADMDAVLGHPLTATEQQLLDTSGVLLWHGGEFSGEIGSRAQRTLTISDPNGEPMQGPRPVDTALTTVPSSEWRFSASGVMTTNTARRLGVPTTAGAILFSDVATAPDQIAEGVLAAGVDPDTVRTFAPPDPIIPAVALPGLALALSALMFLVSSTTVWAGARSNATFLTMLMTLGLAPSTARRVLWIQYGMVLSVATVAGMVLAVIPVATVMMLLPGYELSIPATNMLALGSSSLLGCLAAIMLATLRIRAAARALDQFA